MKHVVHVPAPIVEVEEFQNEDLPLAAFHRGADPQQSDPTLFAAGQDMSEGGVILYVET